MTWQTTVKLLAIPLFLCIAVSTQAQQGPADRKSGNAPPAESAPVDLGENAALRYWQAHALLRSMSSEDQKVLVDAHSRSRRDGPLDAQAGEVLQKTEARAAMALLHRGTDLEQCNWGLDLEYLGDPRLPLTQVEAARSLSRLAHVRARYYFENRQTVAAIEDTLAALHLARHLGSDNFIVHMLVQFAIEGTHLQDLAYYLPQLDKQELEMLQVQLNRLPEGGSLEGVAEREAALTSAWLGSRAQQVQNQEDLLALLRELLLWLDEDTPEHLEDIIEHYFEAAHGDPEQFRKQVDQLEDYHREMGRILQLDAEHFCKEVDQLLVRGKDNPLFYHLSVGGYQALHRSYAFRTARLALIQAAIAVVEEGPDALARFPDPFGDEPFHYRPRDKGFELESKLIHYDDQPVSLRVGPGP